MPNRKIYLLSPKEFSPETIAVAFAKTSRSPDSFSKIAAELNEENSAKFHERWVVGYGHASVAEHAVIHIAIENVSRLAVECIESNRLASYTEKSTRYQKWDSENFFTPVELENHPLKREYLKTSRLLFDTYSRSLTSVRAQVVSRNPREENETDEAYDRRIRVKYVDACRFLLPASALANLGMTANARTLEHAIGKMLSHPLEEVKQIGEEVKKVALEEIPTLVKYANSQPYLINTSKAVSQTYQIINDQTNDRGWCQLVDYDPDGELKVLASALYRFGQGSYASVIEKLRAMSDTEREDIANALLGQLGEHDAPLRELEYTSYTFDLILDQGGYTEFKRHRMMTQTPQPLTARLGYVLPRLIRDAGFEPQYRSAMDSAAETYEKLAAWNPHVASYIVCNGFNRRVLFTMNLREAFAFCQLRAAVNAHFSMRHVAQRVAEEIRHVHPLLAKYMRLPDETWQDIEQQNF
jgi:thymidylate synthase ThyX